MFTLAKTILYDTGLYCVSSSPAYHVIYKNGVVFLSIRKETVESILACQLRR